MPARQRRDWPPGIRQTWAPFATNTGSRSCRAPDLGGNVDHVRQLPLLVIEGQPVGRIAGGKATLGTETQAVEIDVPARCLNAALDQIGGLKFGQFGAHEPKYGDFSLWQIPQWSEIA